MEEVKNSLIPSNFDKHGLVVELMSDKMFNKTSKKNKRFKKSIKKIPKTKLGKENILSRNLVTETQKIFNS